ncbi:hypothetical protein ASZ90_003938 [hydrocarbon metagenome]|uniref:Uncharacterized protein n=1 Tax=hydrocarbon metagenome TaxID=938273 RepID=A0A0W8G159_9ZZZZ
MGGKATVLLVLGFSLIFLVVGYNFGNLTNRSVDNSVSYFSRTSAYNIAGSGANMALNQIFIDPTWTTGINNLAIGEGLVNVSVTSSSDVLIVTSIGSFNGESSTVIVKLKASNFAKYAWYAGNMSSKVFVTGDTIWGPLHTESKLNIGGSPVFWGKVTALKGMNPSEKNLAKNGYYPEFHGGYESGVSVPIPNNYQFTDQKAAAIDGLASGGASYFTGTDVWLTFNADGTVTYRTGSGSDSSTYSTPITQSLSTFAPNNIIYVGYGNVYTSGTVNGRITIAAGESSGSGHGNVYLVDDLVYTQPPMIWDPSINNYVVNEASTDMLGILASNNVRIANTTANVQDKDINLHAAIFAAQGGFEMDDKTIPPSGTLKLMGSAVAAKEEQIAIADNSGNITNGYKRHVVYDERMLTTVPPLFPTTDQFEIISWYE